MNTTTSTAAQAYLDRLRRELADLPPGEVEEIVQDLEPQVAAIAAELDAEPSLGTVDDHLGDPAEYARELRSAMGVPGGTTPHQPVWATRVTVGVVAMTTLAAVLGAYLTGWVNRDFPRPVLVFLAFGLFASWFTLGRRARGVADIVTLPEYRWAHARLATTPAVGYLRSLRPGWVLAKTALVLVGSAWLCRWMGMYNSLMTVGMIAIAAASVVVTHRAATDRRYLWLSLPFAGWALGAAIKMLDLVPALLMGNGYYY